MLPINPILTPFLFIIIIIIVVTIPNRQ